MKRIVILSLLTTITCNAAQFNEGLVAKFLTTKPQHMTLSEIEELSVTTRAHPNVFRTPAGVEASCNAARKGQVLALGFLHRGGADEACNKHGFNAINTESHSRLVTLDSLKMLLASGFNPNIPNQHGDTSLEHATRHGIPLATTIIAQAGGRDKTGKFPYGLALQLHQQPTSSQEESSWGRSDRQSKAAEILTGFDNFCTSPITLPSETKAYVQGNPDLMKIPGLRSATTTTMVIYTGK